MILADLDLTTREKNILKRANIKSMEELMETEYGFDDRHLERIRKKAYDAGWDEDMPTGTLQQFKCLDCNSIWYGESEENTVCGCPLCSSGFNESYQAYEINSVLKERGMNLIDDEKWFKAIVSDLYSENPGMAKRLTIIQKDGFQHKIASLMNIEDPVKKKQEKHRCIKYLENSFGMSYKNADEAYDIFSRILDSGEFNEDVIHGYALEKIQWDYFKNKQISMLIKALEIYALCNTEDKNALDLLMFFTHYFIDLEKTYDDLIALRSYLICNAENFYYYFGDYAKKYKVKRRGELCDYGLDEWICLHFLGLDEKGHIDDFVYSFEHIRQTTLEHYFGNVLEGIYIRYAVLLMCGCGTKRNIEKALRILGQYYKPARKHDYRVYLYNCLRLISRGVCFKNNGPVRQDDIERIKGFIKVKELKDIKGIDYCHSYEELITYAWYWCDNADITYFRADKLVQKGIDLEELSKRYDVPSYVIRHLNEAGYRTTSDLKDLKVSAVKAISGLGKTSSKKIQRALKDYYSEVGWKMLSDGNEST